MVVALLGAAGCQTVCDEVAEEAEAGGCAVGVLPDDSNQDSDLECSGDRELRATCLLDNTDNVCSITEDEARHVEECIVAGD